MPQTYTTETRPCIDALQIYTGEQALRFQAEWRREIDYIRFETVTLPDDPQQKMAVDLTLRSGDGQCALIVLGILIEDDSIRFPALLEGWRAENLAFLAEKIRVELRTPPQNLEIRALHPTPRLNVEEMSIERVLPGLRDYGSVVDHLRRYLFLLAHLHPGDVFECACGTGYGAALLSRLDSAQLSAYRGIDISPAAVHAACGNLVPDARFSFHVADLSAALPHRHQNVISLETLEHTPNPYRFIELLIDKMAPEGQLLLSLPAETWGGSHFNPHHVSNWNRKRVETFLAQYFDEIHIFSQRLSLLGPSTFEASALSESHPDEDCDAGFFARLRQPKQQKRPTLIVKRAGAMGDLIWVTPILSALRRQYPQHNLVVATRKTDVFIRNPDVDLVFNHQYEPLAGDALVDLDWAYERRRDLHILAAYAVTAGISLISPQPALYPSRGQYQQCAHRLAQHFGRQSVERLLAVHMAVTTPDRVWPKAHWRDCLHALLQQDAALGIVVLGNDADFAAADIGLDSDRVLCLKGKLQLLNTAATLSFCDLLVAPDSGLLHVAAAMQTPYLGLFGMADPACRLPFSTSSRAIWSDIECRNCIQELPAHSSPHCPLEHVACMDNIRPEAVLAATRDMLANALPKRWRARCQLSGVILDAPVSAPSVSTQPQAIAAFQSGDFDQATALFADLMQAEPANPLPPAYLAFICARQGLVEEARNFIAEAERLSPGNVNFRAGLGETFLKANRPDLAEEFLHAAIAAEPDLFSAYPALAEAMRQNGQMSEAIQLLQGAVIMPSPAQETLRGLLLEWLSQQGDIETLVEFCDQQKSQPALQALGLALSPRTSASPDRIRAMAQNIVPAATAPAPIRPDRPLCIAFLVSDFRREQFTERLKALLLHLPPERFITCVLYNDPESGLHELAQQCSILNDYCLVLSSQNDDEALKTLADMGVQVLINMDGAGAKNRLSLFGAAPVPRKFSWDDTSLLREAGFACIQGEALARENDDLILRLPGMGELHAFFPDVAIAPRPTDAPRCFGCLCAAIHYSRANWRLFAKLLAQTPENRLIINLAELGGPAQEFIGAFFAAEGIAPERLEFIHAADAESISAAWNRVDVGLAPLFGPGDAALPLGLWMEKPYLALAGDAPWSRRPAAWLGALGLDDYIAATPDALLTLAANLSHVRKHTGAIPGLRQKFRALPGASAQDFALDFAKRLEAILFA
jgi:ADP-heptose:LPS heptosyltransferase/predicted O-linked N-acetylglucosamine transferase (SPINDLY family)/2-polyprenyl-3-methyl-5-hydroxy-6-metoxy-1,4-benzoquinol methylase